ncbi:unnamed protein product [Prorocentrum cordatum]|uniref:Uncharacterized protein n=1 Tax=Prorocentrum cordatum TaxID=2364126 RepID=A0ABN9TXQ1_9DINO|nr:unnamed protein product [Polarella glacialis]
MTSHRRGPNDTSIEDWCVTLHIPLDSYDQAHRLRLMDHITTAFPDVTIEDWCAALLIPFKGFRNDLRPQYIGQRIHAAAILRAEPQWPDQFDAAFIKQWARQHPEDWERHLRAWLPTSKLHASRADAPVSITAWCVALGIPFDMQLCAAQLHECIEKIVHQVHLLLRIPIWEQPLRFAAVVHWAKRHPDVWPSLLRGVALDPALDARCRAYDIGSADLRRHRRQRANQILADSELYATLPVTADDLDILRTGHYDALLDEVYGTSVAHPRATDSEGIGCRWILDTMTIPVSTDGGPGLRPDYALQPDSDGRIPCMPACLSCRLDLSRNSAAPLRRALANDNLILREPVAFRKNGAKLSPMTFAMFALARMLSRTIIAEKTEKDGRDMEYPSVRPTPNVEPDTAPPPANKHPLPPETADALGRDSGDVNLHCAAADISTGALEADRAACEFAAELELLSSKCATDAPATDVTIDTESLQALAKYLKTDEYRKQLDSALKAVDAAESREPAARTQPKRDQLCNVGSALQSKTSRWQREDKFDGDLEGDRNVVIFEVQGEWSESATTWSSRPSYQEQRQTVTGVPLSQCSTHDGSDEQPDLVPDAQSDEQPDKQPDIQSDHAPDAEDELAEWQRGAADAGRSWHCIEEDDGTPLMPMEVLKAEVREAVDERKAAERAAAEAQARERATLGELRAEALSLHARRLEEEAVALEACAERSCLAAAHEEKQAEAEERVGSELQSESEAIRRRTKALQKTARASQLAARKASEAATRAKDETSRINEQLAATTAECQALTKQTAWYDVFTWVALALCVMLCAMLFRSP